ncbi:MAG: hypothetical protein ACE5GX_16655 [Thermoanaerobaculia bacterium]
MCAEVWAAYPGDREVGVLFLLGQKGEVDFREAYVQAQGEYITSPSLAKLAEVWEKVRPYFATGFEEGLEDWDFESSEGFTVVESGDPTHGKVLQMRPSGPRTHALFPGSDTWGSYRLEGDVLFPTNEHSYLGFIYNFVRSESGREDLGSIYIKGNGSYVRANPRRDWNPGRSLYEEFRTPLENGDAIVVGQWQHFALEVSGPEAHLYVGDVSTPKVTFDLYEGSEGLAGLKPRGVGGPVWVDNLSAVPLEQPSYRGPRLPRNLAYRPEQLVTEWEVLGPLTQADRMLEVAPTKVVLVEEAGRSFRWRPFHTDARGAIITSRVVDFIGPATVAYFRTRITSDSPVAFELSSADDTAVWVDDRFAGYGYAQRFAWYDFGWNREHYSNDRIRIPAGSHVVTIRVRGGRYAAGGFFARLAPLPDDGD